MDTREQESESCFDDDETSMWAGDDPDGELSGTWQPDAVEQGESE